MPILKNERYELMAQNLAKGLTQSQAFEAAGFRGDRSNSSKYAKRPEIVGRVAELRAEAEAKR